VALKACLFSLVLLLFGTFVCCSAAQSEPKHSVHHHMPPFAFGARRVYIVQGNSRTHTALVLNYTHETPLNSHKLIEIPEPKIPSSTCCQQLRVVDDWLHVAILSIGRLSPHLSSRCQEDGDTEGIPCRTMTIANMGSK
jgi:hypothetical protein